MGREQVDHRDPRSILEEQEEVGVTAVASATDLAIAMNRYNFWLLRGKDNDAIAHRVYTGSYVVSPDVLADWTLHRIARHFGFGRSATHNLVREFERKFAVRSIHARSEEDRQTYSRAYHDRNGAAAHTYNPLTLKRA